MPPTKSFKDDNREPDDLKGEHERAAPVARGSEDGKSSSLDRSDDTDEMELFEDDLFEEVDLDAQSDGDGPDA